MIDQLDFLTTIPDEKWVFEILRPALTEVLLQNNAGIQNIHSSEGKNYSSVSYLKYDPYDCSKKPSKQLAFRICCRNDSHYFGVSAKFSSYVTPAMASSLINDGTSDGFYNFEFVPTSSGILSFAPLLCAALELTIDSVQKEFDCCSRYEECSDAGKCLNPSSALAVACGYRKIMKSGRIFYGKNRNV